MNRSNQILAGFASLLLAGAVFALPLMLLDDPPIRWMFGGMAVFGLAALYNFAPVTMGDFFRQGRETYHEVRGHEEES